MKAKLFILTIALIVVYSFKGAAQNNVGIGTTTPDPSAALDVTSTTQGFLPPRMTYLERNNISSPAAGLIIYCSDCGFGGEIQFYTGTEWRKISKANASMPFGDLLGTDIDGQQGSEAFGNAVAFSADGNKLVVGAPFYDNGGLPDRGVVRIYEWTGSGWSQMGGNLQGEAAGDYFGISVTISGDGLRIAAGASANDGTTGDPLDNRGHVRIFEWNGFSWVQMGSDIDGVTGGDESGTSVSLSPNGSRLAIGSPFHDAAKGHVRIFTWTGLIWSQLGAEIDGEAAGDRSGCAVSLSNTGSRVAIGAIFNGGTGALAGHARIYQLIGGTWTQLGADIDAAAAGDRFGSSISISGDGTRVAIGAPYHDGNTGQVGIYYWSGIQWLQLGNYLDGELVNDAAGSSVSLSFTGEKIAIGVIGHASGTGRTKVYAWSTTLGDWMQTSPDIVGEAAGDFSGWSVSLSGDGSRVAIGAINNNGFAADAGHVRVYQ
jgi:hypothetical protein